jgi:hypothetical protein
MAAKMRNGFFILLVLLWAGSSTAIEPRFFTTSPPNAVGSGARAMGVGGAFIAVGDDATAASWNPACLIQLEKPEASFVFTDDYRDIGGDKSNGVTDLNYLSWSFPFAIQDINMIVSFNYQRLFDFYFNYAKNLAPNNIPPVLQGYMINTGSGFPQLFTGQYDIYNLSMHSEGSNSSIISNQEGALGAFAPAFAIQLLPQLSIGFTYNFWNTAWMGNSYHSHYQETKNSYSRDDGGYAWDTNGDCTCNGGQPCLGELSGMGGKSKGETVDNLACIDQWVPQSVVDGAHLYDGSPSEPNPKVHIASVNSKTIIDQEYELQGSNYNLGFLFDTGGRWSFGGVYRSRLAMSSRRTATWSLVQTGTNEAHGSGIDVYNEHVYFPESFGLGAGYRYSDALSFTADVTRTNWNQYAYELQNGTRYSLVSGLRQDVAEVDPTTTVRAGAEYLIIKPKYVVPLRVGAFYDPEPGIHKPDDVWGGTIGTGFAWKYLVFDLTYFYRWGNSVLLSSSTDLAHTQITDEKRGKLTQQQIMFSTILHFQ